MNRLAFLAAAFVFAIASSVHAQTPPPITPPATGSEKITCLQAGVPKTCTSAQIAALAAPVGTQSANTVFAGPTTGSPALATFRGLVSADIPAINLAASGNGGVTGILPVANGGTGAAIGSVGLFFATPAATSGAPSFRSIALSDFPSGTGLIATTNAILTAMPSTYGTVTRTGYYVAGDVPPLTYTASGSLCSLNAGAGDGGSQIPTSDSKCWIAGFGASGPDVREFGAKGDGSTDDTAAVQSWVTYLYTNGRVGAVPAAQFKLTSTITAPAANNWGWQGQGKYKSAFFFAGAGLTSNIFDFGGTGAMSQNSLFQGFSVFSFVMMNGGTAFKLTNFLNPVIDDVTFGGELYAKNTWNGIWFNGVHEAKLTRFDIQGQHDGIIVNDGNFGNSTNSDLYLNTGYTNQNGGAGIRQAGGFGGLNIGQVQALNNTAGQLIIDNSISTNSNRETILSSNFVADGVGVTQDDIVINSPNSSSANLISAGTIGSASRYGINVVSWPNGYINIGAGRIYNNGSDAIHMADSTVTLNCGAGATVDTNGGIGVYSSSTNTKSYMSCPLFGNTSGNIATTIGNWNTSFTPVLTAGTGTFTSATASLRYTVTGKTISFRALVAITTNGTAAGSVNITLPFAAAATSVAVGRAASVSGKALDGFINGSSMAITNYDNTYPGSNGENLVVSGTYEVQ